MEDPRDNYLKNVDFNDIEVREYPKIAFLCGGNPDVLSDRDATPPTKQYFPSVRSYVSRLLTIMNPGLQYKNAEDVKDWNSYSAYDDLIEFEKDIAHICKAIVLFVEGPGSIAELGSFAMIPEITEKLIVFAHSDYSNPVSYISLGPLKKIDSARQDRIHYITWKMDEITLNSEEVTVVLAESMDEWGPYACDSIKSFVDERHHMEHASNEYKRTKEALYIHDIVSLFKAVSEPEIDKYFKSANHKINGADITRSLFCLEKLELIRPINRGNKIFYVPNDPSSGRYLSLNSNMDSARLAFQLNEYYKHHSQLARREAINAVTGGG